MIHTPELADKIFPYVGLPTNREKELGSVGRSVLHERAERSN